MPFDPFKDGQAALEEDKPFDPFANGQAKPDSSAVGDFMTRLGASGWKATGDVAAYLGHLHTSLNDLVNSINESTYQALTGAPLDPALRKKAGLPEKTTFDLDRSEADREAQAFAKAGAALRSIGESVTPDPARDNTAASSVAEVGGSMVPVIAAGPAGLPAMALSLAGITSEGIRKYSIEQGDSPEIADAKAKLAAAIAAPTALIPQLPVRGGAGVLERVLTRAGEGSAVNTGAEGATQLATEGKVDSERLKQAAKIGAGFGAVVAVPEALAAPRTKPKSISPDATREGAKPGAASPAFDPFAGGQAEPITPAPAESGAPLEGAVLSTNQSEPIPPPAPGVNAGPPLEAYTPNPRLTTDHAREIEQRFGEQLAADPEAALDAYRAANTDDKGVLTIDVDKIRELSPDYVADPTNSPAVHEPASAFSKFILTKALESAPPGDVLFLAGGGGSGKSTARAVLPELTQGAKIVVDSTLASEGSAIKRIDQALAAGRKVDVAYVHADVAQAWRQSEARRIRKGRPVPFADLAAAHAGSFPTVSALAEHYAGNPDVRFKFIDNTGKPNDIKAVTQRDILKRISLKAGLGEAEAARITQELENELRAKQGPEVLPGSQGSGEGSGNAGPGGSPGQAAAGAVSDLAGEPAAVRGPGGQGSGASHPIVEFPVDRIQVNQDIKQFKSNADAKTGVVEQLGGKYQREPLTRQVLIWQKANGDHEIITGRHKLDLAKRSGEKTIPAQILREADGWTLDRVKAVDAEVNIRGGQGQVKDFAQYFRSNPALTLEQAAAKGLTGRAKGAAGWLLGREATPALWDLYANNQLPEAKAVAIARGAPGHEAAQASAIRSAAGKTPGELELYARNLSRSADRANTAEQMGFAGVAQDFADFEREASAVAKVQAERIRSNNELITAAAGAARKPEAARKMGLPVEDPAALQAKVDQLRATNERLANPDEATWKELRAAAGLKPLQEPGGGAGSAPNIDSGVEASPAPAFQDPAQVGMFARRKAAPPSRDQADIFDSGPLAGGETGGDQTFNLASESSQDFSGIMEEKAAIAEAKAAQEQAQGSLFRRERKSSDAQAALDFARETPEQRAAITAELAQARAKWKAEAERIAPGLMSRFRLKFGDPDLLVQEGKVRPEDLTGWEQAFYDGHERMLYLFDQSMQKNADTFTRLNLLHEMGHAHWDTLTPRRQLELGELWRQETGDRTGPLFDGRKQLRAGVAQGVESDIKEWYAERLAWANHDWARARAEGRDAKIFGPVARAAQEFRILLQQFKEWIGQLRGSSVDTDFRQFLDQGKRFESAGAPAGLELAAAAQREQGFARRAPGSAHSPQSVADRMRGAIDDIGSWMRRELTSRGHMPEEIYSARVARDGRVGAIEKQMKFALEDLDTAVRAVHGGWGAMSAADQVKMNDVLGGRAPVTALDPRLQKPIATMRQHVDVLSRRMVREGVVSGDLASRVAGNVGFYLNRSFRKFDDPAWVKKVEPQVLDRASSFIRGELREKVIDKLADQQAAAQGLKSRQSQAYKNIRDTLWHDPTIQPDEANVQGLVEYLLTKDVAEASDLFASGSGARKDLSILTKRKEIAPEIRALLGEYQDPRVNYARSVAKMGQLLETHHFLTDAKAAGLGKFFFQEPLPGAAVRLAAEGSKALAPLDGLYTTPEIADAFHRAFDEQRPQNAAWRAYLGLNGWVKTAKTVLHPITQVRNFVANFGFLVANGHYHAADGGARVLQAMRAEFGRGDLAARDYLTRLARYKIVGESTAAGELREALHQAGIKMTGIEQWTDHRALAAAKAPFRAAERMYRINDEVFKIFAFENEVQHWRQALPSAPIEQIERIAAERVHNTLPTYDKVPLAVQRIRRAALLGSFVSFPAEVVRTGYHTLRYALTDLRSNNPIVRGMGARRLAGIAAAAAIWPAASMTSRWLNNLDNQDETDLRRFMPDWNKNAELLYTGPNQQGRASLVDLSYLDPWAYLRKPLLAAMRGQDLGDAVGSAALEATQPFFGEGVLAKVLLDITRNRDDQGRPVYDEQAGPIDRQLQKLEHAWSAAEPGFITQGRRIVRAARGEVSPSGRAYQLGDELLAVTTGARSQSLDVAQAHHFQAGKFAGELNLATINYTRVRDRQGADPAEVAQAKAKFEQTRATLFDDLHRDTEAAQRLGVPDIQILANLKASGLSKGELVTALTGTVFPFVDRPVGKYEQLRRTLQAQRN